MIKKLFLGTFIITIVGAKSFANCNPRLSSIPNVSLNSSSLVTVSFNVIRGDNEACHYFVTFNEGNRNNSYDRFLERNSVQYDYNLYKESNLQTILKELPEASSNEVIQGDFTAGGNSVVQHQFFVFRPDQPIKPAGLYRDTIRARLYEGNFSVNADQEDSDNFQISYQIPTEVRLSLVDSGGAFNSLDVTQSLDFGTLDVGESLAFDIMVQANAGYILTMSSQNNGQLKHVQTSSQLIPFALSVDGVNRDLGSSSTAPVNIASGSGVTPNDGNRHAVVVTIGSFNNKMSGLYRDNITITITTP